VHEQEINMQNQEIQENFFRLAIAFPTGLHLVCGTIGSSGLRHQKCRMQGFQKHDPKDCRGNPYPLMTVQALVTNKNTKQCRR